METQETLAHPLDRGGGGDGRQNGIVIKDGELLHAAADDSLTGVNRRPRLSIVAPGASPEEAAAVVAAVERFMRETAPVAAPPDPGPDAWQLAALREGVSRQPSPPEFW